MKKIEDKGVTQGVADGAMEDRSGYEVSPTAADALRRSIDSEVRAGWMRINPASHPNPAVPAPIVDQNDEMTQPLRKVRLPSADRPDPVIFPTQALYARSQEDLLTATSINPTPTTVPPPIAALAGNIGERHVLIFVGLPLVGKRTIALRLKRYLRFFHGAKCKAFDIAKFTPPSSNGGNGAMSPMSPMDANAHAHDFFDTLRNFLEGSDDKPANSNGAAMEVDNVANATATATAAARRASVNGVDPVDRNAKNVDSGRVAIIFSSDCMSTFYENWSGSSKERRRWILSSLATLSDSSKSKIRVKTIFIEVTLTKDGLVDNILEQKLDRDIREG